MRRRTFILATVAIALLIRLFRIGHQSLWVDEILTLAVSVPKPGLDIWDYLKYNIHGPLHSLVVYLFHFVSLDDAWLRLPSALAGAGAVYYLYRWFEVWLGERPARIGAIVLALHPLHVFYSQELRNYSFVFFFAAMASYQFHRLLTKETSGGVARYALLMACAALSNFSAAFLYAAHTMIYLLRRPFRWRRVGRWGVASVLILVLISPWVYRVYRVIDVQRLVTPVAPGQMDDDERLRGGTTVTAAVFPYTLYAFGVGFTLGPSLRELHENPQMGPVLQQHRLAIAWVALVFGFLLVTGAVEAMSMGRRRWHIAAYLVLPILFTVVLCWQNAKAYNIRYVMLGLPGYLALLSLALAAFQPRVARVAAVALAVTLVWSLGNYYFNGRFARENVRAAAETVAGQARDSDCILAPTIREVFEHYYRPANPIYSVYAPPGMPPKRVTAQLDSVFANCDRVWYVRAREWVDDREGRVLASMRDEYPSVESTEFEGVTLYLFAR